MKGPWHRNTVVEYAKHSARAQDISSSPFAKVLVLYCGGTIGMKRDQLRGYCPLPGYLAGILAKTECFSDPLFMKRSMVECEVDLSTMAAECGPVLMMPPSIYGRRVAFQIREYDPLKDSSNMCMSDWTTLASDIERYYHNYDSFVILHGTDTMAYTASALSFLLENLGKTVLLTGSQIPFSEVRNDAQENLLGALTVAGHYTIPEVCLFFDNKLYRGNRTTKSNAMEFDAFDSPNLKPLAKLGVNIEIEWAEILRATEIRPFCAHKAMDPNVGCLRFFPGITEACVRAFLQEPMRGVVLETFGTGNVPDNRPEIMAAIAEATQRGVVVVNISQCPKGAVAEMYSTGHSLRAAGVVAGHDMTTECALTKLSYLLSFPDHDRMTVSRLMGESLRGELTVPLLERRDSSLSPASWLGSVLHSTLIATTAGHRDAVDALLRPLLFHEAAAQGDLEALRDLGCREMSVDATDYDGRTALHVAVRCGQMEAVRWLVHHGANVHFRDPLDRNSVYEAFEWWAQKRDALSLDIIEFLVAAGGRLPRRSHRLTDHLLRATRGGDLEVMRMMERLGFDLTVTDVEGRNAMHVARASNQEEVVAWLEQIGMGI